VHHRPLLHRLTKSAIIMLSSFQPVVGGRARGLVAGERRRLALAASWARPCASSARGACAASAPAARSS
jgi:hypothetical protein